MPETAEFLPFTDNVYRTGAKKISFCKKKFPNFFFYKNMIKTVIHSSRLGRTNRLTFTAWGKQSIDMLQHLENVGGQFEISGIENIREINTPCVYVSNHMSVLETFVLPCLLIPYQKIAFVVKESLVKYPVFKHVIGNLEPVVVGRENPRQDLVTVLEQGAERLSRGISMVIFPQRTRMMHFNPEEFNTIGIKLAKRAGVPVVPVAVKTDAWGQGKLVKDFGKVDPAKAVYITFGEPMAITGNGQEQHQKCIEFIKAHTEEWFRKQETGK
ncbi:MAG TPA: lysophospholipid acyltransferase family protein [bacterium]|nr:lysophospholipid acyltransferase family protein [bacterium]HPN46115.1 lysophospholipid acyltransferase family protein [bacterium]